MFANTRNSNKGNNEWNSRALRVFQLLDKAWHAERCNVAHASEFVAPEFVAPFTSSQHLRLFRTRGEYLGLGSECLQAGDSVWFVPGSSVPLILRSQNAKPSSANRYRLVSGTYLHGLWEAKQYLRDWNDV